MVEACCIAGFMSSSLYNYPSRVCQHRSVCWKYS